MREIITIHIGQCGTQIGAKYWGDIGHEHNIDANGFSIPETDPQTSWLRQERINVCYSESKHNRYIPRAILTDLDPVIIENIKGNHLENLFKADNFLTGKGSTDNLWGKGYYTEGLNMVNQVLEIVRKEAENCDHLQSIQVSHSIGGGTGSGMGSRVISKLMEEYRGNVLTSFTHAPFSTLPGIEVEPYNAVLSTHSLIENIDQTYFFDNNALKRICTENLKLENAKFDEFNHLISCAMSGITSCLRFHGQLNNDMQKLALSMTPFPSLRFFIPGIAPLASPHTMDNQSLTVPDIAEHMLDSKHYLTTCTDWEKKKNLAMGIIIRGKVYIKEVYEHISAQQMKNRDKFVDAIPDSVKAAICSAAPINMELTSTYIANTSAITTLLEDMLHHFDLLLKRKALLHKYTAEGMELAEFTEAKANVEQLCYEYKEFDNKN